MKLCPKKGKLLASSTQSGVMHGKTIPRSHSVLMRACMAGDCSQLHVSIECPTDMRAGDERLAGSRQAWSLFGARIRIPRAILGLGS